MNSMQGNSEQLLEVNDRDDRSDKESAGFIFKVRSQEELEEWKKMRSVEYWIHKLTSDQKKVEDTPPPPDSNVDETRSNDGDTVNNQQLVVFMGDKESSSLSELLKEAEVEATGMMEASLPTVDEEMILLPRKMLENISVKIDEQNKSLNEKIDMLAASVNKLTKEKNEGIIVTQRLIGMLAGLAVPKTGREGDVIEGGQPTDESESRLLDIVTPDVFQSSPPRRRSQPRGSTKCDECGTILASSSSKCVHIQRIHKGKLWICQYCKKEFKSPSDKSVHLKVEHADVHVVVIKKRKRKMQQDEESSRE